VIKFRDYQVGAITAAKEIIESGKNGVIVKPTGSGKSLVIAGVARDIPGDVLVLQPNKEILEQNFAKLYELGGRNISIYSASVGIKRKGKVTFATIGSIINKLDLFKSVDAVMVDECDLVNSKEGQYKTLIEYLEKPVVGLTASPYRMHASYGGQVVEAKFLHRTRPRIFDHIKYVVQNADLHAQGYLSPIEYHVDQDYNPYKIALNSTGLNYDEKSLQAYNKASHLCQKAAETVMDNYSKINHWLIFVSSIAESMEIASLLNLSGVQVAHVDGETSKLERERILYGFKSGQIKVVTNVGVLTTGFDFPALDGIVLASPMMSLRLYYQKVGRGVRVHESKEACHVFDLCANVERFGKPDKYVIEPGDGYKYRLRSEEKYLTGVNYVTGKDLEKQRDKGKPAAAGATPATTKGKEVIPFGKYRNWSIDKVPIDYLEWCTKNFSDGPWKTAFKSELSSRLAALAVAQ
jgi:DNA repair protein RadD